MAILAASPARAILIADEFTYGGTNGFEASRALATDFLNYPLFEAVGLVTTFWEDGATTTGTASLLNNQWVLTAAHNWNTQTMVDMEFTINGTAYLADMSALNQHPLWLNPPPPLEGDKKMSASQGWDIALFKLVTPVTNTIAYPQLYTRSDEVGKTSISVGMGVIGKGTTPWEGQTNSPPLTYAAFNTIDRATSVTWSNYTGGALVTDFDGTTNPARNTLGISYNTNGDNWVWGPQTNIVTALDLPGTITGNDSSSAQVMLGTNIVEGSTGPGDSGGPTFIQDEDGTWKLAGITSWGYNPWDVLTSTNTNAGGRGLYGDAANMTRVSENADWIYSVIPEPSTWALLIISGLGLGLFRLRQIGIFKTSHALPYPELAQTPASHHSAPTGRADSQLCLERPGKCTRISEAACFANRG